MKVLIQGLGLAPGTIELALEREKPDITHIICSDYQMKYMAFGIGRVDPSWVVVERAAERTATKVLWHVCDIHNVESVGEAVARVFEQVKPTDEIVINSTGGSANVKMFLGASAVVLSKVMPIRIVSSVHYPGGLQLYRDQTAPLKVVFEQLFGPFYEKMEKATLAAIMDAIVDAIVVLDLEGKVVFSNQACSRMLGIKREDFVGRPVVEVLGLKTSGEEFMSKVRRAVEVGDFEQFESTVVVGGRQVPLSISGGVLKDADGRVSHVALVIRDITQLKRAEAERERALAEKATLIDVMSDNIIVCDSQRRILMVNVAAQRRLADCGIDAQKLVGKDICEAIPFIRSEDAKRHAELVRKVAEQDSAGPIEIAGVGGRWYSITAFRLKDPEGKPTGFFTVCRDITELKRAEEVLREQYTKLKEIDEMKSRFISVATHELRTPLVSIKGYTELIRGGYAGEVPKEIGGMLEIVARNADRLAALTNDLLDQQRLESGRFQISPELFDLREVIKQTIQEVRPQISQKKQTLRVEIPEKPLPVKADRIRIAQVLINLLSNASKFTPERGDISLSLRDVGKFVETRVADTGIGISPDDIQKLFKPFPDIRRPVHYPSTGLGLSICKGIVELHGGRIWAESAGKDMGSIFTFTLPKGERAGV